MIKVIFFDVFGTLVDWRTSIVELGQSMIKKEIHLITTMINPTSSAKFKTSSDSAVTDEARQ